MLKCNFFSYQLLLVILVAILSLLSISCSKTPDVRLTMCQDLVILLLKSPENVEWKEHKPIMTGHDDLEMLTTFSITHSDGEVFNEQASCFYPYEQDEIGAETFNTPTSAYSTYPTKMLFKGKEIAKEQLVSMINQVMINQGKQVIIKVKEGAILAKEKAEEGIKKINQEVEK